MPAGEAGRACRACLQDEVEHDAGHHLEGGEALGRRASCGPMQSGSAEAMSGSATNAVAFSAGFGNSLSTAAVMMPSVPSEPMNRSFRS